MKPAQFEYTAPETLDDALAALVRCNDGGGDAKILAGGQSLMPMLAMRVARPTLLVDLRRVPGIDGIREENGYIVIGAMTSKRAAEDSPLIREKQPLFHAATELVAHAQIRNRGSVGGTFAHADPAAEYPAVALVLDMEIKAVGPDGERVIPAADFFITYMTTALDQNEILTEVRMPALTPNTGWSIQEMARRGGDLALAGVAVTLLLEGGICQDVRIAAFGITATAIRLTAGEDLLRGQRPEQVLLRQAAETAATALEEPISCIHASSEYRRGLVKTLVERCLIEAAQRAGGNKA